MGAAHPTRENSITTNTFTMYYTVKFKNNAPVKVWAVDRAQAIKQACRETRGYLPMQQQRQNVVSAKISKVQ